DGLRGVGLEGDRRRGLRTVQLPLEPARGGACRPPHRRAPGPPRPAHPQGLRAARNDLRRAHHAPPGKAHHAPDARRALEGPPPQHGSPEGGHRAARLRAGEPPPGLPEGGVRHVRGHDPAHGSGRDREADERAAAHRGGGRAAGGADGRPGGRGRGAPRRARGDGTPTAPGGARDAVARRAAGAGEDRDRAARRRQGGAERSLPVREREEVQEVPRAGVTLMRASRAPGGRSPRPGRGPSGAWGRGAPALAGGARVGGRGGRLAAVLVNAGNANACTGAEGLRTAEVSTALAARLLGCAPGAVAPCATGRIGVQVERARLLRGVRAAVAALSAAGLPAAAHAITTTDAFPKTAVRRLRLGGRSVTVAALGKGGGMIAPRMATLLVFVVTDARVAPAAARRTLRAAVDGTLNAITVDGDTSTNDTVLFLAGGAA